MACSRAPWFTHARRRSLTCSVVLSLLLSVLSPSAGAFPAASDTSVELGRSRYGFKGTEKCLMRKINRVRRAHEMRSLDWDKHIGYVARRHAVAMAQQRGVYHDYYLGQKVTRWKRLGQNTGRGGRCARIFRSFMRSSPHRSNILGRWRHLGVGTHWAGGRLYVQQVFESRYNPGNVYSYP